MGNRHSDSAPDEPLREAEWPSDPVELLRVLYPRLLALAKFLDPSDQAADLVQETLTEMLVRYPEFSGIQRPLGYARTVLFRLAAASRRRASRDVPADLQERLEREDRVEERVTQRLDLVKAIDTLGPKQRAAIILKFFYRLDTREIAEVLGSSEITVRSQVMRAMRRLKPLVTDDPGSER